MSGGLSNFHMAPMQTSHYAKGDSRATGILTTAVKGGTVPTKIPKLSLNCKQRRILRRIGGT
jgi:hypothetical protein